MRHQWIIAAVVMAASFAQAKPPPGWDPAKLATDLKTTDTEARAKALAKVYDWFKVDPIDGAKELRLFWGKSLLDSQQYDELAKLCFAGIVIAPDDTGQVEELLQLRISALIALGQPDQALQCAKSFFNVARSKPTAKAILLVAKCLEKARPEQSDIYEQFQNQQTQGAQPNETATRSGLMDTIQIDASIYDEAITVFQKQDLADNKSILAYGNLLLLAGRADEAGKVFGQLNTQDEHLRVDAMARAIKAQDGVIGRANHYLQQGSGI